VAKAKWGLGHVAVRTLYKGLFVPITSYAAADWNDLLNDKAKKKNAHKIAEDDPPAGHEDLQDIH
jgi:hypothetical protein